MVDRSVGSSYGLSYGLSVFAIDPGETTGWAWACVGYPELKKYGVFRSLHRASQSRSGTLASDRRLEIGQIGHNSSFKDYWMSEVMQCEDILIEIMRMDSLTRRVSKEKVSGISVVVIEDFILREQTKDRSLLSPVRITSAIRDKLSTQFPEVPVVLQPASSKAVITDKRLKNAELWTPGKPHAMDAMRHLNIYLRGI